MNYDLHDDLELFCWCIAESKEPGVTMDKNRRKVAAGDLFETIRGYGFDPDRYAAKPDPAPRRGRPPKSLEGGQA